MDSLINAAARALAKGDPFTALNLVALREDAAALALRGTAMAQLGDFERARSLMRRAGRAFGSKEALARARCVVADAEIALAARELARGGSLDAARATLEMHGDHVNAAHARQLDIRRLLLLGRIDEAEHALSTLDAMALPPALRAVHELIVAGIAMRRLDARTARDALARAEAAARVARIPALVAEVASAQALLRAPAARLLVHGEARLLSLEDVETVLASQALIVDACRHEVRCEGATVSLARRPVLFTLLRALGEAWPRDLPRAELIARAFRTRLADESHRARLRVEIGRLRHALKMFVDVRATSRGFMLVPHRDRELVVLARPSEEEHPAVLALLADGEAWSSSSLALALGVSQRTAQRALDALAAAGKVHAFGRGPARRWTTPPAPGFATPLLLPITPSGG